MQLNEIFEQFSIETIVDKTNIPKEKLADLKDRDWSKFKRAQAMGFLNILEREFNIDLSDAKDECKSFFAEQTPQHTSAKIDFVESQVAQSSNGGVVSKIIALVTLVALGYTGWYYYDKQNPNYPTKAATKPNETANNNSKNADTKSMQNSNALEENRSIIDAKTEDNIENKTNNTTTQSSNNKFDITSTNTTKEVQNSNSLDQNKTKLEPSSNQNSTTDSTQNANNTQESSIKAQVESLLNEGNKTTNEDNKTIQNDNNESIFATNDTNSTLNENNDSLQTENSTNTTSQNQEELNTTDMLNQDNTNIQTQEDAKLPDSIDLAVNAKSLWIGIYNLKSGKRVSKIIKKPLKLDLTNGKLVIITGHSKFSLITNNETKKFTNRGKSYLLLSKEDGIKVLTKKEYKELTKKRAW